jgi:hypothetical protein
LDLSELEGIKVVGGMIENKIKTKLQSKPKHFSLRTAFERRHLAVMSGVFLEAYLLYFSRRAEKKKS